MAAMPILSCGQHRAIAHPHRAPITSTKPTDQQRGNPRTMTRTVSLIQLGIGHVGAAVVELVVRRAARWRDDYDIAVRYAALADSTALVVAPEPESGQDGPLAPTLAGALERRHAGLPLAISPSSVFWNSADAVLEGALARAAAPEDVVVLDCATGERTAPLLVTARAAGASVVLANKDPLAGPLERFRALMGRAGRGSLRLSATVGAGLPVAATLAALIASGDTLLALDARASGSLGFLCDRLSSGVRFDAALREAMARGYTEPDPRQDLSGFDVARKLLILARLAGGDAELADVRVESLVPPGAETLERDTFLARLPRYTDHLAARAEAARARDRVLRYVGRIDERGALRAELVDLPADAPLARGGGPENVFIVRTARYDANPLVISGPGAGVSVTSGAVVADLLRALGVV
jgi:homoserine dehydrogenase